MQILRRALTREQLSEVAEETFGDLVKAVVDVDRELLAVDAELHSDLESLLLEDGSRQKHLWGINLYPAMTGDDFVEFDSMINIRPSQGNRSRGVDRPEVRDKIVRVVRKWVRI
jgi:hypothetical protein